MELSCDRCRARLSTSDEPAAGRTYRLPCTCGNTMVVEVGGPDAGARPLAGAARELTRPVPDDPFLRAMAAGREGRADVTARLDHERLAERDPEAGLDDSAEYRVTGAVSFDDLLRRARLKGFLAGAAAGAVGFAIVVALLAVATSRPEGTATLVVREPPAAAAASLEPIRQGLPEPDRAPARKRAGAAAGAAERRARPSPAERPVAEAGVVTDAGVPSRASAPAVAPERASRAPEAGSGAPAPAAAPAAAPPAEPAEAVPVAERAGSQPAPSAVGSRPAASPAGKPGRPFPPEEVAGALRARRAAVRDCVAATPGDAPAVRAQRFGLTVVIEPSGRVSDVQVDDPGIEGSPLGACLLRAARTMSFAPFEGAPYRVELALDYGEPE